MYGFLLSRRWLVAGGVVLAAVATMIGLGVWQLRRHGQVGADNDRLRARLELPAVPIEEVLPPGADPADASYRRADVTGAYDVQSEVVLDNRSYNGQPGRHLLTPLVTDAGRAVIVDRGWVPLGLTESQQQEVRAPAGAARVVGVLFPSERKGVFGASIPAEGRVTAIPRVDVARIAKQLPYPSYPLYLRLESARPPAGGELPIPPGLPEPDDGPHLSYAFQWFIFATIALAVFGALARRDAARRARAGSTT